MNQAHHYDLAITRLDGTRHVIARRRIGSLTAVLASEPIPDGPVILQVNAAPRAGASALPFPTPTYTFSYALAHNPPRELATGEARYLATEIAGGFTGTYFAVYATANQASTTTPADYDWFEYRPQ